VRTVVTISAFFWLACAGRGAWGQLLNLGGTTPPPPGTGVAAMSLAESLSTEAAVLMGRGAARDRAKGSVRALAAALIRSGEEAGQPGSARIVLGRTLAANLGSLDTVFDDDRGPADAAVLELLSHDVQAGLPRTQAGGTEPERFIRDVFAQLLHAAGEPRGAYGWLGVSGSGGDLGPLIDDWVRRGATKAESAPVLHALAGTLDVGTRWVSYRRSAEFLRSLLVDASGILSGSFSGIDAGARRALGVEFERAATAVADPATLVDGLARLRRLARGAQLMRDVSGLEVSGTGGAAAVKRAQAGLAQALASSPDDPAADLRSLAGFERVLWLVRARGGLPADMALVRQVRPAYRTLLSESRQTELKLAEALPAVLKLTDAMTEPGVLAAIAAHQRLINDLRLLAALSARMAEPAGGEPASREPQVSKEWERVAARVLDLGQDLSRREERAGSLVALRDLADRASRLSALAGEADLRAPGGSPAWSAVTRERRADLAAAITERRRAWLDAWERGQYDTAQKEGEKLESLGSLMGVLTDAARAWDAASSEGGGASPAYSALQAWPGWQMSRETLAVLARGLDDRAGAAVAAALDGDPVKVREAVAGLRSGYAAALLAGRLMDYASGYGFESGPAAVLYEVATGGPVEGWSWMADQRDALADVCRYAEEIPTADRLGDAERASLLRRFVEARAAGVLDALDRAR
jgi:hypothetical protein